jgi:hypothetical protein
MFFHGLACNYLIGVVEFKSKGIFGIGTLILDLVNVREKHNNLLLI